MADTRGAEILRLLDPKAGQRSWSGGATALGCLRGVSPEQAAWKPSARIPGIWELTLHVAYWKYAVRRGLEGSPKGSFPRSPANWPRVPEVRDARAWKEDRALLRSEQERLAKAARTFDPKRLDRKAPGTGAHRFIDVLMGIVHHDAHHVGQIQLLKRLCRARGCSR